MEGLEAILTRRSVRKFQSKPVEDDKIISILHAGMSAPSAHNSQPWEFIVVKDKEKISALSVFIKDWAPLRTAPLVIITLGNLEGYKASLPAFFVQDCSAASQNILLAAHALGLGAVWLGVYPKEKEVDEVRRICEIPEKINPFSLIALGYPEVITKKIRPYREEIIFFDKYK